MSGVCFSLSLGLRPPSGSGSPPSSSHTRALPLSRIHQSYKDVLAEGALVLYPRSGPHSPPGAPLLPPSPLRHAPGAPSEHEAPEELSGRRPAEQRPEQRPAGRAGEAGRLPGRCSLSGDAAPRDGLPACRGDAPPGHGTQVIPAAGRPPAPFAAADAAPPQSAGKRWLALRGRKQLETKAGHSKARARSVPTSTCAGSFPWDLILERAGRSKPSFLLT